jgi:hypothetical protein
MGEASVNSALQRARATLAASVITPEDTVPPTDEAQRQLLARYVAAFEQYDLKALTALIKTDARQSMPPYDMWLSGRDDFLAWWYGPGIGCRGSRLVPVETTNGTVAFGQYKPSASGSGFDPWAPQVIESQNGEIVRVHVLPRHRSPVSDVRSPGATRLVAVAGTSAQQDLLQAHELDEILELLRASVHMHGATKATGGQPQPRQRIDGYGVGVKTADVAPGPGGVASGNESAEAIAEPGEIGKRDRAPDGEADRGLLAHRYWLDVRRARKSSATDDF